MATSKNWLSKMQGWEGAVVSKENPHDHVVRSSSPSVNFLFGKGHGLPQGLTLVLGGPPKGGKTLLCKSFIGQMHQDYPDAFAAKFNTEFRELGQATPQEDEHIWGIDPKRYLAFEVNSPMLIFDRIETDLAALCDEGLPLRLVVIDSITGIQGRRSMNADTIETQQIGDLALTLGEGFKRILPVQRKYGFSVILTAHIRAEMDMLEQKRGNKWRMAMPKAVEHYAEYSIYIEPNRNKEGRTDLGGNEFLDAGLKDLNDKAEQTGHKIRMKMKDSSCGPKGRSGEFTLDYRHGIINIHEEAFLLGVGRGVIERPNMVSYIFGEQKWTGKQVMLDALKENPALRNAILAEVKRRDNAGAYDAEDAANADEEAE